MRASLLCVTLVVASAACTSTRPFTDNHGRKIPGSIATMERINLGGIRQAVWFRARSTSAPALILLNGGPGASESALFRHFDAELENHFLMVYWEQRGTGRSYDSDIPRSSMTIQRMLQDLDELVDTVRVRFANERVILLGHSWGTILGTLYAQAHPEKVAAYVGVAQIANFARGEQASLEWALQQAAIKNDRRALIALRKLLPAPRSVDEELELGRWVERFGGSLRGGLSTGKLILAALKTDEAGLWDLVLFGRGNRFSLRALRPEYSTIDLTRYRRFEVPVVFILGRYDWHIPSVHAEAYFHQITAPRKLLFWFERSAHNPPFEEPDAFVSTLVHHVRPLAIDEPSKQSKTGS